MAFTTRAEYVVILNVAIRKGQAAGFRLTFPSPATTTVAASYDFNATASPAALTILATER